MSVWQPTSMGRMLPSALFSAKVSCCAYFFPRDWDKSAPAELWFFTRYWEGVQGFIAATVAWQNCWTWRSVYPNKVRWNISAILKHSTTDYYTLDCELSFTRTHAVMEATRLQPPKFMTQLNHVTGLVEGQSAHFECQLVPVNDPDLTVEWYFNGQLLRSGKKSFIT